MKSFKRVTCVESQTTACLSENRSSNLTACLSAIINAAQSKDEFWFGTQYATTCPDGTGSIKCNNYDPNVVDSLVSRTFGTYSINPALIDRYIDVKYTTRTGQYSGCGNRWTHATSKTFHLDPISRDYYHPFDTILQPEITWQYSESDYYFLLFTDVGNRRAHGTFINIRNNDIANAEIIKPYDVPSSSAGTLDYPLLHWQIVNIPNGTVSEGTELKTYRGPQPPDNKPHQYYFLLYEQKYLINTTNIERFAGAGQNCSSSLQGRCRYDVGAFVNETGLTLVGASWYFTTTDDYVRYIYTEIVGRDKDSFCTGVPGYAKPCPVSGSNALAQGSQFVRVVFVLMTIMMTI
ncbi:hypothetical protein KUTeg_010448 [Tegillarca granosa]|uniref:Phosphatidylethanolamine-binding protein n=1 Tax=Tegillarca granosa TaxID=220873 RepID=A0ABQ9F9Y3_TEGGR|nr:hypothetical protein KUTeg_010448 [Tegillarca granosa]